MSKFDLKDFLKNNRLTETSEKLLNETKFYVWYNKKKHEVDADSLYKAKEKFIKQNKVPKSKQGLIAVKSADAMKKGEFRFEDVNEEKDFYNKTVKFKHGSKEMTGDVVRKDGGKLRIDIGNNKYVKKSPSEVEIVESVNEELKVGDRVKIQQGHDKTANGRIKLSGKSGTITDVMSSSYVVDVDGVRKYTIRKDDVVAESINESKKGFDLREFLKENR